MVNHQDKKNPITCFQFGKKTLFLGHILDCCPRIWNVTAENLFLKRIIITLGLVRLPDPVVGLGLTTLEPEVLHRSDASQNDHKSKCYIPKNDYLNIFNTCNVATLHHVVCHVPSFDVDIEATSAAE